MKAAGKGTIRPMHSFYGAFTHTMHWDGLVNSMYERLHWNTSSYERSPSHPSATCVWMHHYCGGEVVLLILLYTPSTVTTTPSKSGLYLYAAGHMFKGACLHDGTCQVFRMTNDHGSMTPEHLTWQARMEGSHWQRSVQHSADDLCCIHSSY